MAGGGVETFTEVSIKKGRTSVANETYHLPDGSVERKEVTTTRRGDLDKTRMSRTVLPDHAVQWSSSAVDVILVQPPSS